MGPRLWICSAGIFVASLALYLFTLAPTVLWGDFGGFQTRAYTGEIGAHPVNHPLWLYLARPLVLLPVGDVAYRVTLSAALFAALALVVVFLLVNYLTRSLLASLLATVALALSHTFWTYAVVPKNYSLNSLMLASMIFLLLLWRDKRRSWHLYAFAFLFGLSLMSHLIMLTAAPAFLFFILMVTRGMKWRPLLGGGLFFLLGLAPYLLLMASTGQTGTTGGFVTGPLAGFAKLLVSPRDLLLALTTLALTLGYQFFFWLIPGLVGIWGLLRRDFTAGAMLALAYLGVVAFVSVPTAEGPAMQHWHLYMTSYVIFALWIGMGLKELRPRLPTTGMGWLVLLVPVLALPILTYAVIPTVARDYPHLLGVRDVPGRDSARFLFTPWKQGVYGARTFGEEVFRTLPPDAIIIADWTLASPLMYLQQVEGQRPDVEIAELYAQEQVPYALKHYQANPLFLANTEAYYDIAGLSQHFDILPQGPVYQLVPKPPLSRTQ
ncbi:MAG: DUF2723 domain-containing protein [Chloroflexi bacterium]|nr:DUF2723 domain-containing protein [Chloroflexota bacterium]